MTDTGIKPIQTFSIKVRVNDGAEIEDVVRELCILASRLGIRCEAECNGVQIWASPGDDEKLLFKEYLMQLKSIALYKIACVRKKYDVR